MAYNDDKDIFKSLCQFLLGTVQPEEYDEAQSNIVNVSIPLRYGTTAVFSCYY